MNDECPVCGNGDEVEFLDRISHLDCVLKVDASLFRASQRAEQAEAEVEKLKTRTCKTCDHRIPPNNCYASVTIFDGDDGENTGTPDDFACNRWEEHNAG